MHWLFFVSQYIHTGILYSLGVLSTLIATGATLYTTCRLFSFSKSPPLRSSTQDALPLSSGVAETFRRVSGNKATVWAPQHEDNKIVGLAAVWNSQEAQRAWAASPEGQEVVSNIKGLSNGALYNDIVVFSEDPLPTLRAKIVELVSWIYTVDQSNARKNDIEKGFKDFRRSVTEKTSEADGGSVSGWGQEFQYEGVLSRRFTLLIGWQSVDAHAACKETKLFKDNVHYLTDYKHTKMEKIVHYAYRQSLAE